MGISKKITSSLVPVVILIVSLLFSQLIFPQNSENCDVEYLKRSKKNFNKAVNAFDHKRYTEAITLLNKVVKNDPTHLDAWHLLGSIYLTERKYSLPGIKKCFSTIIEICPEYDNYAYYHLARIYFGEEDYSQALEYINVFLNDVDRIKNDNDYFNAINIQDYSSFYLKMINNPVPFDPKPVEGVSSKMDEYLAILSPDNRMIFFTRKVKIPPLLDDLTPKTKYEERFFYSQKESHQFNEGIKMPYPFNQNKNEGGATLSLDNNYLFYTICDFSEGSKYYNCDICFSRKLAGYWSEIEKVGGGVNSDIDWESQPSVSSDGKTLYFVSDRPGGLGGYDIYVSNNIDGVWSVPQNLGSPINTEGNEKSPFIHTDNKTLYFSSDGRMGMGGYDIFFSKMNEDKKWNTPINIGYPINSKEDDVGFFVSVDGHYGYFASNKLNGIGGWDLYSFELYEEARPEEIIVIKGQMGDENVSELKKVKVELKNIGTRVITNIEVDTLTGSYAYVEEMKDDYLLTIKKEGFVNELKYISKNHYEIAETIDLKMEPRPIEEGKSYRLNDVYFEFNSHQLTRESFFVVEEYLNFLNENPNIKIDIQGHTDNVGSEDDNLYLSELRAKTVYNYLIAAGLPSSRLSYQGFGESKPLEDNSTEEGRAMNRRTEFKITEIGR